MKTEELEVVMTSRAEKPLIGQLIEDSYGISCGGGEEVEVCQKSSSTSEMTAE